MKFFQLLCVLILVTSCGVKVNYDYDKQTDFSNYKTYNYYSDLETGLSELDTKRLLNSLDKALIAKGLSLSENPDFYINIQSEEYQNNQRNSVGVGVGGGGRNVGGGISVGIPIGQAKVSRDIQFDFIDENGKGLFWQAISSGEYNPKASPEQRESHLETLVNKVLSGFPPKK